MRAAAPDIGEPDDEVAPDDDDDDDDEETVIEARSSVIAVKADWICSADPRIVI
jgi:hypothetical protein